MIGLGVRLAFRPQRLTPPTTVLTPLLASSAVS
jgi:hypothetical protein